MSDSEYEIAKDQWLRQDHPREALRHALKAVDLNEDNADAQHLVGLIYLDFCRRNTGTTTDECRLSDAEAAVKKALDLRADYREARNTLGVVLIHEKRYADAIRVLEPLTADILYSTPENAWGNLGWAYLEKGDLDRAITALERSVAAQPLFCVGNFRLGMAHEKKAQWATALEAYTRALETDQPACRALQDGYLGRGRVLEKLGRADDARADLERCRDLGAGTPAGKDCGSMLAKLK
jgi:tetratricopeptide (TPR) repeat protein